MPVIVTVDGVTLEHGGVLADVAPTMLELLGIDQPEAMTFVSRRPIDLKGASLARPDLRGKIKQEIESPIFELFVLQSE